MLLAFLLSFHVVLEVLAQSLVLVLHFVHLLGDDQVCRRQDVFDFLVELLAVVFFAVFDLLDDSVVFELLLDLLFALALLLLLEPQLVLLVLPHHLSQSGAF